MLAYHDVIGVGGNPDASGFQGPGPARYKLDWDQFNAHLEAIAAATGRAPVLASDLIEGRAGADSWSITFDDGGSSSVTIGEELARRGWPGQFFVVSARVGTPGFLGADGIRALTGMGHVIGTHSVSHPRRMSALPQEELLEEWRGSALALEELVGSPVEIGAVPGGYYSRRVARAAAAAGLTALFTSEPVRAVRRVDGCLVIGRASVHSGTLAARSAELATGRSLPWQRGRLAWDARKVAKAVGGEAYLKLRTAALARRRRSTASGKPGS
ncbi:MAG: polysaccharide deacetylase family protein [Actinomycetota bacterium]